VPGEKIMLRTDCWRPAAAAAGSARLCTVLCSDRCSAGGGGVFTVDSQSVTSRSDGTRAGAVPCPFMPLSRRHISVCLPPSCAAPVMGHVLPYPLPLPLVFFRKLITRAVSVKQRSWCLFVCLSCHTAMCTQIWTRQGATLHTASKSFGPSV